MSDNLAIKTDKLSKNYGWGRWKNAAVRHLDLEVQQGSVYAFLGRNGAGKTTTIRMLMGMLERTEGNISILGHDPDRKPVEVRSRVGYVAENQAMYNWMTIGEIIGFSQAFYDTWSEQTATRMLEKFKLDRKQKLKSLSRGMYGKVALLLALSQKPELLILDDPMMGLDTAVRREFMEGVIDALHEEKCTVFFSTHIIPEVAKVADRVGIMKEGELVYSGGLDALTDSVKQVRLLFEDGVPEDIECESLISKQRSGHEWVLTVRDFSPTVLGALDKYGAKSKDVESLDLEEIFVQMTA